MVLGLHYSLLQMDGGKQEVTISKTLEGWAPNSSGVPYDGSPNEEYWGIVDIDRNKKQTFDVVKKAYNKAKK